MTSAAELARLRQGLYRFFAGTLAPPDQVLLEQLTAAAVYLETMDLDGYAFSREWKGLASLLPSGAAVLDLAPEHVRLFASGTNGVLCPPIESFYRSAGRNEATADMVTAIQRDYREMGVTTTAAGEASDHVTTQLEIMSTLCARESAAWNSELEVDSKRLLDVQARFLRRHLAAWLPKLRVRVLDAGPHCFYAVALDAVHSFVVHDLDLIAGLRQWSGPAA